MEVAQRSRRARGPGNLFALQTPSAVTVQTSGWSPAVPRSPKKAKTTWAQYTWWRRASSQLPGACRRKFRGTSARSSLAACTRIPTAGSSTRMIRKLFGRTLREQRHDMRFMPAQYFKPYVKTNKSDYIDAEARPGWRTPWSEGERTGPGSVRACTRSRDPLKIHTTRVHSSPSPVWWPVRMSLMCKHCLA